MRKFLRTLLYMLLKFKIYTFLKGKFAEYLQNFLGKTEEEIEKQTTKNPPGGKFLGGIFFPEDGRFFCLWSFVVTKPFPRQELVLPGRKRERYRLMLKKSDITVTTQYAFIFL